MNNSMNVPTKTKRKSKTIPSTKNTIQPNRKIDYGMSKERFMKMFGSKSISYDDFLDQFKVSYGKMLKYCDFETKFPKDDFRISDKHTVMLYFYKILVEKKHEILGDLYDNYLAIPDKLDWTIEDNPLLSGDSINVRKNDSARRVIRNIFCDEILNDTRVTNSIARSPTFIGTLKMAYNDYILYDRFFAPSSIKTMMNSDSLNTFVYLVQSYQPKASILNPYMIYWLMRTQFPEAKRIFSPVMSWGSYLYASIHIPSIVEYTGIDVIPSVCEKSRRMLELVKGTKYEQHESPMNIQIFCKPSETFIKDRTFCKNHSGRYDLIFYCPPYYTFELYDSPNQSVDTYKSYSEWLKGYFEPTIELCREVCNPTNGRMVFIIGNYKDIKGNSYNLIGDCCAIIEKYFVLEKNYKLESRKAAMKTHEKTTGEHLMIFKKIII